MMFAIYASLMCLALGLFTSMTFLALTHIFIIIPCFYFLSKTNFKKWNMSSWFLLIMILAFILSVLLNQDIAAKGFSPLTKMKYYLIAVLSIAPISYYFSKLDEETSTKKIHFLLLALFITTTIASLYGMSCAWMKFNFLRSEVIRSGRNGGFAGMLLNYAHNLALFQVITTGMIYYRNEVKKYINLNFLYVVWGINVVALIMTYARGALLAFIVAIPFYFFKNNKKVFTATLLGILFLAGIIYNFFIQNTLQHVSDLGRISQWKAALAGFQERPIFGLGYLNFESMSIPLKIKYGIEGITFGGHAHNNYLEALASTGVVGFIFFMLWQIFWLIEMYKRDDLIAKIAIPFIIAFVVGGLTQATFTLGANLFFLMSFYTLTQLNINILKKE